ncbi:MAG: hypothetical protein DCC55_01560 [Chloroflexi bacterium]|nr:MAG: hypothetical protein DCC55_01560 [Chloroflexota bacterium]
MKPQRETASFVLRFTHDLWQDQQGEPRVEWRGQVSRVQDGAELRFTDLAEAISFIKDSLLKLTMGCIPKGDQVYQEKAMQESFKLWERFAQGYTDMIVAAMQRTSKQPQTAQRQPGESPEQPPQSWWLIPPECPPAHVLDPATVIENHAQLLQTVTALQAQLEALNAKVAQLEATVKTQ